MIRSGTGKSLSILDSNGITWHTISGYKIRQNLLTNPAFQTASGTTNVRTNLATNPSFEAASGTVNARTNLATNPSFEASNGTTNVRINLATNPSFETASGTVTVRTNLATDPCASVVTTDANLAGWRSTRWFGGGTATGTHTLITGATDGPRGIPTYIRKTWTGGTASSGGDTGFDHTGGGTAGLTVAAGKIYTISSFLRASVARTGVAFSVVFYDVAGAAIGTSTNGTAASLTAGEWKRINLTVTAPTGAVKAFLCSDVDMGTIWATGDYLDGTGLLVEESSALLPYFDGTSTIRNLFTNPSMPANTSTWDIYSAATIGWQSGIGAVGNGFARATFTGTTATGGFFGGDTPAIPGETLTISGWVRSSVAQRVSIALEWRTAVAYVGQTYGTEVVLVPNVWTRISGIGLVANSGTTVARMIVGARSGTGGVSWVSGNTFDIDGLMLERSADLNPYYEGTGDYTYAWTVAANASSSIQTGVGIASVTGSLASIQSTLWASRGGTKSLRHISTLSHTDTYASINGDAGAMRLGMVAGRSYTFSATCYIPSGTTTGRDIRAYYKNPASGAGYVTAISPNTALDFTNKRRTSVTMAIPSDATEAFVRLYNGQSAGIGGDVWWDDLLVEESPVMGAYFDGANPIQNLISNPSLTTDTTGWGLFQTVARSTTNLFGKPAFAITRTAGSVAIASTDKMPVTAGDVVSYSALGAVPTGGCGMTIDAEFYDAANTFVGWGSRGEIATTGSGSGSAQVVSANTPVRFGKAGTVVPAGATQVVIRAYRDFGADGISYVTDFLLELSPTINPFYAGTGDFTYAWSGAAVASASLQTGTKATSWFAIDGNSTKVWQSATAVRTGPKSAAVYCNGTITGQGIYSDPPALTGYSTGDIVTGSAYVLGTAGVTAEVVLATIGGTLAFTNFTFTGVLQRVSTTLTISAAATTGPYLLIRTKTTAQVALFWVDDVLIEKSPIVGRYFDGANPIANTVTNPDLSTGLGNWISGGTLTRVVSHGKAWASVPAGTYGYVSFPIISGRYYAGAIRVRGPVGHVIGITTTDNVVGGIVDPVTSVIPASGELVINAPSGALPARGASAFIGISNGAASAVMVTEVYIEEVAGPGIYATSTFFKGQGDFTYVWSGTANASTSYQQVTTPADTLSNISTIPVRSSIWASATGVNSLRTVPISSSNGSYISVGGDVGGLRLGMEAGKTYTISANVYLSTPQTGTLFTYARKIVGFTKATSGSSAIEYPSTSAPNTAGSSRISLTFTIPAGAAEAFVRLYNGASAGGGDVWFDDVLVEEAPVALPYFDGANPITNLASNGTFATTANLEQGGNWTHTSSTDKAMFGTTSLKAVRNSTSAGAGYFATLPVAVKKGETITASVYANGGTGTYKIAIGSTGFPAYAGTSWAGSDGWNRYSITATAEQDGHMVVFMHDDLNTSPVIGTTIYFDGLLIERSATVNAFYEGTGDYTYVWSGTANASTSIQQGTGVTMVVGSWQASGLAAKVVKSSHWATRPGQSSLRITSNGPNDSGAYIGSSTGLILTPGKTYTISAMFYQHTIQTGTLSARARRILVDQNDGVTWWSVLSAAAPNVIGASRVSVTLTVNAAATSTPIYLYNGSGVAADVWWDDILIEESSGALPYFDAANPAQQNLVANPSFETDLTGWSAANGASLIRDTSTFYMGVASAKIVQPTFSGQSGAAWNATTISGLPYTISAWIKASDAGIVAIQTPTGAQSAKHTGSGNWERLSITWTATITGTSSGYIVTNNPTAGQTFWVDAVLIEQSAALNPYYYEGQGDYTYVWSGTANASTSIQQAPGVVGMASYWAEANWASFQSAISPKSGAKNWRMFARGASTFLYGTSGTNGTAVVATEIVTASFYVKPSVTRSFSAIAAWNSGASSSYGPLTSCPAGVWTRVYVTATVPAATTLMTTYFNTETVSTPGDVYDFDNFLIEKTSTVKDYFDGTTAAAGDFTYVWSGTVNGSSSHQQSPGFAGYVTESGLKTWKSATGTGMIVNTGNGSSGTSVAFNTPLPEGETATIWVKVRAVGSTANFDTWLWGGVGADNYNGSTTVGTVWSIVRKQVYITPAIAAAAKMFFTVGQGQVEIEKVVLTTGTAYDDGYFDGDTPDDEYFMYAWEGTPHASKSIATP